MAARIGHTISGVASSQPGTNHAIRSPIGRRIGKKMAATMSELPTWRRFSSRSVEAWRFAIDHFRVCEGRPPAADM